MTLPVLSYLSAELVAQLDMAVSILIGVLAVHEDVSTLSIGVEFSHLDASPH